MSPFVWITKETNNNRFCVKCKSTDNLHRHHILSDLYFDKYLNENCHQDYTQCVLLCNQCHGLITSLNHIFRQYYWIIVDIVDGRSEDEGTIEEFKLLKSFHEEVYNKFLSEENSNLLQKSYRKKLAKELMRQFLHKHHQGNVLQMVRGVGQCWRAT